MNSHRGRFAALSGALLLQTINNAHAQGAPAEAPAVPVAVSLQRTDPGEPNQAVFATGSGGDARVIGTAELSGLELYDLDGRRLARIDAGEASGLDIRQGVELTGGPATIVAATDSTDNRLRLFQLEQGVPREMTARPILLGYAAENVCLHRSGVDGAFYAFVVGDGGEVEQLMLFETPDGRLDARQVRRLSLPSPVNYCVADDRLGQVYVSNEAIGIFRFDADPETDVAPVLIDANRLGNFAGEAGGLALFDGSDGARWLIAADVEANRLLVYDREQADRFVGAVTVTGPEGLLVEEPGGLYASSAALGSAFPHGALLVANEEARRFEMIDSRAVAQALQLSIGIPQGVAGPAAPAFPAVRPRIETVPVPSSGDAADDPAIWVDEANPAQSLVIGTNKRAGLHLYAMDGSELQFVPDGKMNNVDLREGFRLGGSEIVLVTASNRTSFGLSIYRLDTAARQLVDVADGVQPTGLADPYGHCLYRSRRTGRTYAFATDPHGLVRQWELVGTREGRVRLRQVRDLRFSGQTEGCVADDETGTLYVGEEGVGLWRLNAEPNGGQSKRLIDSVEANPQLRADVEGVGIYDLGGGRGYIVVSSQGNDSYAVYRREGDNAYLGSFIVVADGAAGIDGISETDGLEITSRNLGPGFEHGAMVAQDGRNVLPTATQNFKIVPWADIARALDLEVRR